MTTAGSVEAFTRALRDQTGELRVALAERALAATPQALTLTLPAWVAAGDGWQVRHCRAGLASLEGAALGTLADTLARELGEALPAAALPGLPGARAVAEPVDEETHARRALRAALPATANVGSVVDRVFPLRLTVPLEPRTAAWRYNAAMAAAPLVLAVADGFSPPVGANAVALWQAAGEAAAPRGLPRVGPATGYARDDLYGQFVDNRQHFRVLPHTAASVSGAGRWSAVRWHDATVRRWQRARLCLGDGDAIHYGLELRFLMPGPTIADTIALAAFCLGLIAVLEARFVPGEVPFERVRGDCAAVLAQGGRALVHWQGRTGAADAAVLAAARGMAAQGLARLGVAAPERRHWLGIIAERAAQAQRLRDALAAAPVAHHPQALAEAAQAGAPVHRWAR